MALLLTVFPAFWIIPSVSDAEAQREPLKIPQILAVLQAREDAMRGIEVSLEVEPPFVSERYRDFLKAQFKSMCLLADTMGLSAPSDDPRRFPDQSKVPSYKLRYLSDRRGRLRYEMHGRSVTATEQAQPWHSTFIYDGHRWSGLSQNRPFLTDGFSVPREGRFLGLDLDWQATNTEPVGDHSLVAVLKRLAELGKVTVLPRAEEGSDSDIVTLLVHTRPFTELPNDLFNEHALCFDMRLGFAPVRHRLRLVRQSQDLLRPATPDYVEERWEDFTEVADGVYLPQSYRMEMHAGVVFPKTGNKYPPGFDFRSADLTTDVRVEMFLTGMSRARVLDITRHLPVDNSLFVLSLPDNAIVNDYSTGKVYTSRSGDLIHLADPLREELRQAVHARRSAMGFQAYVVLVVINAILLAFTMVVLYRTWRRRQRLRTPASS